MDCREAQQRLHEDVEGLLGQEESEALSSHIADCEVCARAQADLAAALGLVRSLKEVEAPPWLTDKIMTAVRNQAEQKPAVAPQKEEGRADGFFSRLFRPFPFRFPAEALATVLIAVGAWYLFQYAHPVRQTERYEPVASRPETPRPSGPDISRAGDSPAPAVLQTPSGPGKTTPSERPAETLTAIEASNTAKPKAAPPAAAAPAPAGEGRSAVLPPPAPAPAVAPPVAQHSPSSAPLHREEATASAGAKDAVRGARQGSSQSLQTKESARKAAPGSPGRQGSKRRLAITATNPNPSAEVTFSLNVADPELAEREIKRLLSQMEVGVVATERFDETVILCTETGAEKAGKVRDRLRRYGRLQEKGPQPEDLEGDLRLRIEIRGLREAQ